MPVEFKDPYENIVSFEMDLTFWKANPWAKHLPVFDEFYRKDHTPDKSESSDILWAIAAVEDVKSPWKQPRQERVQLITVKFLPGKSYDDYKYLQVAYRKNIMLREERRLDQALDYLDHIVDKLIEIDLSNVEDAKTVKAIQDGTGKIEEQVKKIKSIKAEMSAKYLQLSAVRGGGQVSMREQRAINRNQNGS